MSSYPRETHYLKDGTEVTIRSACANDLSQILEFMSLIFKSSKFLATKPDEFKPDPKEEKSSFEKDILSPTKLLLLATIDNHIIGLVDFRNHNIKRRAHSGTLDIFINQNVRGKGAGKLLLASLIKWAKGVQMLERLELTVFSDNIPAISLYKQLGFIEEGRKVRAIRYNNGKYSDELLMAKLLTPNE